MRRKDESAAGFKPYSIIVVGCGLIGASMAFGLKRLLGEECRIDGVELNANHRQVVSESGVFQAVYKSLPQPPALYDLAVLAVPVDTACRLLAETAGIADLTMDVCSVKQPICEKADELGLRDRFVPTHPMAGIASEGPRDADPDLFLDRSWIMVDGWTAVAAVQPLIEGLGARYERVHSAEQHDQLMAVVSHSTHLTSLASMLAYQETRENLPENAALYCGPAFRDITRLSASPSGFWTSTLLANRHSTAEQMRRILGQIQGFVDVLENGDEEGLRRRLEGARSARQKWEQEQKGRGPT